MKISRKHCLKKKKKKKLWTPDLTSKKSYLLNMDSIQIKLHKLELRIQKKNPEFPHFLKKRIFLISNFTTRPIWLNSRFEKNFQNFNGFQNQAFEKKKYTNSFPLSPIKKNNNFHTIIFDYIRWINVDNILFKKNMFTKKCWIPNK